MKAIYSLWTPPCRRDSPDGLRHGFRSVDAHLRMLALSMALSRRWFGRVELWADEWSAASVHRLVPGVETIVAFGELDGLPPGLWSMGKLAAQAAQREPWIHIDSDALFLADPHHVLQHDLAFQSVDEADARNYIKMARHFCKLGVPMPAEYALKPTDAIYNCGVVMDRVGALREVNETAVRVACQFADKFPQWDAGPTYLLEQGWQSAVARGLPVGMVLDRMDNECARAAGGFVHLFGGHKQSAELEEKVARRLHREFPAISRGLAARGSTA